MNQEYTLLDCGNERRLEQFGDIIIDRPAPQAEWKKTKGLSEWNTSDAFYHRDDRFKGWSESSNFPDDWKIQVGDIIMKLSASKNNQVGIFPEHFINNIWMKEIIQKSDKPLNILNTFAYTGMATLMAAKAKHGTQVCHVDGAKASVDMARENAKLSGLEDAPIRWIVDDVITFMEREVKRKRKYDGIILDPPAFGKGKKRLWKLEKDLPKLLELTNQLLSDDASFVILSCHAEDMSTFELVQYLEQLDAFKGIEAEPVELVIKSETGNNLPASIGARIKK